MFSQSLFAQLIRMLILLVMTIYAVKQCQPLIDAFAENATSGGCHQQDSLKHKHMEHH